METKRNIINLFYILGSAFHLSEAAVRTTKVFGADPSGGLWGAEVSEAATGEATLLSGVGYTPQEYNSRISTVSYDSASRRMLFETMEPHQISYAPLCSKSAEPPRVLTQITSVPLRDPAMGNCVNCETSAFALFDSKIYFLVVGEYFTNDGEIHRVAQIRHMLSCADCGPITKSAEDYTYVDTVSCSHLVVEVLHQEFTMLNIDDIEIKGGKNMKIVQDEEDGHLDFFFHLTNVTHSDSEGDKIVLSLWHARSDGSSEDLIHTRADSRFADLRMSALGSVDYKDGTLCWTTGTLIKCGDFSNAAGLQHIKVVMQPAGAVVAGACQGTDNDLVGIVSGVTVLRGGDNRVVVFGCYPDAPGQGGAGIMRLHRTEEHGEIRPLAQGDHRLLAGSIFTNRHVVRKCSFGQDLPICLGPPKPTTTPPPVETTTLNEQQSDGTGGGNDVNSGGGNSPGGNQDGGKPSIEEKDPVADHNVDNSAVTCILSCLMYILPVLVYVL